ncbi:MAG: hypothetical protein ACYCZN_00575 [Candidatus Dormibacteria bacterium]
MVATIEPSRHPHQGSSRAAESGTLERLELGAGHSLVLYAGLRLGAAEQRFQAAGGVGGLAKDGHLVLLFRASRWSVAGVPELWIGEQSGGLRLEMIRASDWGQLSVPAVALLRCPGFAGAASAVIHLRSGDIEVAAALPATWADQMGSSPPLAD